MSRDRSRGRVRPQTTHLRLRSPRPRPAGAAACLHVAAAWDLVTGRAASISGGVCARAEHTRRASLRSDRSRVAAPNSALGSTAHAGQHMRGVQASKAKQSKRLGESICSVRGTTSLRAHAFSAVASPIHHPTTMITPSRPTSKLTLFIRISKAADNSTGHFVKPSVVDRVGSEPETLERARLPFG